ncbi:MAG: hypothetical protein NT157_05225 [Candidatus Micrarchaeota archaeon]|nr:hypothetical protein [Candidatus Micrarchaeota archaeon]
MLDSRRWGGMGLNEKKGAREARKELARGGMSGKRARRLAEVAVPLAERVQHYPDLRSALRAVGEHIREQKMVGREKILEVIEEINGVLVRINKTKGRIGTRELKAKLKKLGKIAEKLENRNFVWLVDNYADLAKDIIPEAVRLLEEGKWYLACPKLVAAMNVLTEKLAHDKKDVLRKNAERAELLSEIIEARHGRNERISRTLAPIVAQLRKSASIQTSMIERLGAAIAAVDSKNAGGAAKIFEKTKTENLRIARELLLEPESSSKRPEMLAQARKIFSERLEQVRAGGIMNSGQKKRISNQLAKLADSLKNSKETVLAEARNNLLSMKKLVIIGEPLGALNRADNVFEFIREAETRTGSQ